MEVVLCWHIAYTSHKLNRAQRNYTIAEHDCLAVVMAISKFRSYIELHQTTEKTHYQILFGQSMVIDGKDYALLNRLKLLNKAGTQIVRKGYEENPRLYNLRSRSKDFFVGQEVNFQLKS